MQRWTYETDVRILPCACASLRRATRVVSQLYDEALRPAGMRVTQFTLLQALASAPGITQGGLGRLLRADSTTLTRTLATLRRKGWVQAERGVDRRQLRLHLAPQGARAYRRAVPYWRSAQARLRKALGDTAWKQLIALSSRTAALSG